MIEETIGRSAKRTGSARKALLVVVLLAVGWVGALLALPSGPALAASTFTVNEIGDGGDINITNPRCDSSTDSGNQCTLRAAIEEANDTANSGGADLIDFDIPDSADPDTAKTIEPESQLPAITEAVTIDGYTQEGSSPNTLAEGNDAVLNVQLDGINQVSAADGLWVDAPDCTIKGLVIRRFDGVGVVIASGGTSGNRVEGNFIGVNRDGITGRGNRTGLALIGAANNTVGGTDPEDRNVISGNDREGIHVFGSSAAGNKIEGNHIGTTADGTADLGNGFGGVRIEDGSGNTVGGTSAGARNVISGNETAGVSIFFQANGTRVEGNHIGIAADGNGDLGNSEEGVQIFGADFTVVGGTTPEAANRIAHNGGDGVEIEGPDTEGNLIFSNSIFDNGGLGIDLVGGTENVDGVTSNDANDLDTGPNGLQNFPKIKTATTSTRTGRTNVSGRLDSDPSQLYEVQCFLTDGAQASGHGEGSTLLATDIVGTDVDGKGRFSCVSESSVLGQQPGQTVSATATNLLDAMGDTSEFSKNKAITIVP